MGGNKLKDRTVVGNDIGATQQVFIDDVINFASLRCPNSGCEGWALQREVRDLDD